MAPHLLHLCRTQWGTKEHCLPLPPSSFDAHLPKLWHPRPSAEAPTPALEPGLPTASESSPETALATHPGSKLLHLPGQPTSAPPKPGGVPPQPLFTHRPRDSQCWEILPLPIA